MPRIPTYNPQINLTAPRAAAPPIYSPAEMGADLASGLVSLGHDISRIALEEKRDADSIAVTEALDVLNRRRTDLLYGDNGLRMRQGKNALGTRQEARTALDQTISEIAQGLTPDQLQVFQAHAAEAANSTDLEMAQHQLTEMKKYHVDRLGSAIDSAVDLGARSEDPTDALEQVRQLHEELAMQTGDSDEEIAQATRKDTSRIWAPKIGRLIDAGSLKTARGVLERHKEELTAEEYSKLDLGIVKGEEQTGARLSAYEIVDLAKQRAGPGPWKPIADAELRRRVEAKELTGDDANKVDVYLNQFEQQENQTREETERRTWEAAGPYFMRGGYRVEAIPYDIRKDLTFQQTQSLEDIAYRISHRGEIERNKWTPKALEAWSKFWDLPPHQRTGAKAQEMLLGLIPDSQMSSLIPALSKAEDKRFPTNEQVNALAEEAAATWKWKNVKGSFIKKEDRLAFDLLKAGLRQEIELRKERDEPWTYEDARQWVSEKTALYYVDKQWSLNNPGNVYGINLYFNPEWLEGSEYEVTLKTPSPFRAGAPPAAPTAAPPAPAPAPREQPVIEGLNQPPAGGAGLEQSIIDAFEAKHKRPPTPGQLRYYLALAQQASQSAGQ